MNEKVTVVNLADGLRLHIVETAKFKTDLFGVFIQRPIDEREATRNTLLTRILEQGTSTYATQQELQHKLDELYGAVLACDVNKYGAKHVMQFKLQVPGYKHVGDQNILRNAMVLLHEVVTSPVMEKGQFNDRIFETEVRNLREEIQGRINDKMAYAVDRCIELMCEDEPYRHYTYGSVEELDRLRNKELMDHYKEVLATSPVDIVVVGDVDPLHIEKIAKETFKLESRSIREVLHAPVLNDIDDVRAFDEVYPVKQGKLTLGYRTGLPYHHRLYEAGLMFSSILGGGASSKLFRNVREKESLCYYIFSRIEKYKGIMMVSSGIDPDNRERVLELIENDFARVQRGEFSEEDVRIARNAMINSLRSVADFPNSFMNFYYAQRLSGRSYDPEGSIKRIEAVTREEIVEAGAGIELDTVFFLSGKEGAGNEHS